MKGLFMKSSLLLGVGSVLLTPTVFAQLEDEFKLEEIIVMAQKRSENLQDVPASIQALGADDILNAGIADLKTFAQRTPGVVFEQKNMALPQLAIRGIGGANPSIAGEPTTGIFVDGVYLPRTAGVVQNLVNIERLEVLKGPQGTLYGRNTIAGAMSIYTQKPDQESSAFIELSTGNRDTWRALGYAEGGLSNSLSASMTIMDSFKGGDRKEDITGKKNDEKNQSLRTRLVFTPNDTLEIDFIVAHADIALDANLEEPLNPDSNYPFMIPVVAYGILDPALPAIIAAQRDVVTKASTTDFYSNSLSESGVIEMKTLTSSMTLRWSLPDFDVTAVTGYYEYELLSIGDFDGTAYDIFTTTDVQDSRSRSQEVRFSSVVGGFFTFDGRLDWMFGLFYFDDDAEQVFKGAEGADFIFNNVSLTGAPIVPSRLKSSSSYLSEIQTQSHAIFGQATYEIFDNFDVTLGLRYSKDKKNYTYEAVTDTLGSPVVLAPFSTADDLVFSSVDPKLVFSYYLSESTLTYVSYSKGYRSGGIQFATPNLAIAEQGFDEEILTSIELGIKSRLMEDRFQLNASIFDYEYEDMQEEDIVINMGVPSSITRNVAESNIQGFELDGKVLVRDKLILEISYAYLDAEYTNFVTATDNFSGNSLGLSPKHSYRFSAQYELNIFQNWLTTLRVDYAWKDDFFYNEDNVISASDVGLTSVSLTMLSNDDKWQLQMLCSNCTDTEYVSSVTDLGGGHGTIATGGRSRFGINVRYTF